MGLKTFIFIGRSGCGKGTQVALLRDNLQKTDSKTPILYIEAGAKFREFLNEDSFTSKLSKEIYEEGNLQPDFLAIRIWSEELREKLNGNEHLIFDGTPRQLREAHVLENALDFYKREDVYVVYLNVSRSWSEERLKSRGREDDLESRDVKKRLDWYDKKVMPAVEYFRNNPRYKFLEINGEQAIENVHKEILEKILAKNLA